MTTSAATATPRRRRRQRCGDGAARRRRQQLTSDGCGCMVAVTAESSRISSSGSSCNGSQLSQGTCDGSGCDDSDISTQQTTWQLFTIHDRLSPTKRWTMNASNNDNTDTHKFSDFPSSNEYTRINGGSVFRTDRAAIPDTQIATLTCMWEQSSCSSRSKMFVL